MKARALLAPIALFAVTLGPALSASANPDNATAHLTVYDAGIAEFLEERTIDLQSGLNTVEWRSLMPKAYIRTVRVIAEGAEIVRQDVTYDGTDVRSEKTPVLHLVLQNRGAAGPKRVQVDYLAPNLSWQNDYSLVLEPTDGAAPPTSAMLDSWVSVYNNTGTDLRASAVDLVAGDIALLLGDNASYNQLSVQRTAQNAAPYDSGESVAPSESSAEVSGLSAFNRFTLGRDISLGANAPVNRFPLFQRAKIAIEQRNIFENEYGTQTLGRGGFILLPRGLEVRLVTKNTAGVPMPAGQVTVYARTGDLAQVVGQDRVGFVPPGQEFSVAQGRSSTLLGTRKILERHEVPYKATPDDTRDKLVTKIEVTLTNRGSLAADAYIRENVEPYRDNQWTITDTSVPNERLGANTIQFKVKVPASGKTTVTYTVETK